MTVDMTIYNSQPWYDTALVCLSGHVATDRMEGAPEQAVSFCPKCGKETICACPECESPIRGYHHGSIELIRSAEEPKAPAFCHACGKPYPWTSEQLAAAQEMARELEELTDTERGLLASSLAEIIVESPSTELAASRVKRLLAKAGPAGAALYRFATDFGAKVAAEIIKS